MPVSSLLLQVKAFLARSEWDSTPKNSGNGLRQFDGNSPKSRHRTSVGKSSLPKQSSTAHRRELLLLWLVTILSTSGARCAGINVSDDYRRICRTRGTCRRAWEHARSGRDMTRKGRCVQTPPTACAWRKTGVRDTAWRLFKVQVGHSPMAPLMWNACPEGSDALFVQQQISTSTSSTTLTNSSISWDRW